jgi:spore coat protein CotF
MLLAGKRASLDSAVDSWTSLREEVVSYMYKWGAIAPENASEDAGVVCIAIVTSHR